MTNSGPSELRYATQKLWLWLHRHILTEQVIVTWVDFVKACHLHILLALYFLSLSLAPASYADVVLFLAVP